MAKVVGIDLGTTNSVVAYMEGTTPTVITNAEGSRLTPSVVAFTKSGERLVGQLAKRQAITNPDRTISSIKRYMGTDHKVTIDGKSYTPQEISAMILQKLAADASTYLGEKVTRAVITAPAYFNDAQRQATKDAGRIAGLDVLRIINEPTAAALAYGLDKKGNETILVWDLGGGTFDVSILEVGDGVFEVKSTNGDTHLGGDDYDKRIVDWLVAEFKKDQAIDLSIDRQAFQRLTEAAEKAKIELSSMVQTSINLPFITADQNGPKHLDYTLTRAKFEQLTADLTERTHQAVSRTRLRDAKLSVEDIKEVVLVGGATRMPVVQNWSSASPRKIRTKASTPTKWSRSALPSRQACSQAKSKTSSCSTSRRSRSDSRPSAAFARRSSSATRRSQRASRRPSRRRTTVRPRWTSTCSKASATWRPTTRRWAVPTRGHSPAPRGVPQVEVTFDIDANGITHVDAKDLGTGKEQRITITASSNLTKMKSIAWSKTRNRMRTRTSASVTKQRSAIRRKPSSTRSKDAQGSRRQGAGV